MHPDKEQTKGTQSPSMSLDSLSKICTLVVYFNSATDDLQMKNQSQR